MNIKPYGYAEQKKLAKYPDRIAHIQECQEAIPNIQDLNLDETQDLQDRLKRYHKELRTYEMSLNAIVGFYRAIIEEAATDCAAIQVLIDNAPADVKKERLLSLKTSKVQTEQQMVFVKQQCKSLSAHIESVKHAKRAVVAALKQNRLVNLSELLKALDKPSC
ncbi:hypothetical protein IJM16_03285 [Candidatus Saccharibacteria bacterium]|nr:hypothetical protein [Candidatus Saccharibacteria bacterium]